MSARALLHLMAAPAVCLALAPPAAAQFSSGSDGSDGALTYAAGLGTVHFDPTAFTPRKDPDGDNVYHFTTITIGVGTQVRLTTARFPEGVPVVWLASGDVQIAGILDLSADFVAGFSNPAVGHAGAGGYRGGAGPAPGIGPRGGNGPGGGSPGNGTLPGGGSAGHRTAGTNNTTGGASTGRAPAGPAYGNPYIVPMTGGSGGGATTFGSAGGSGGGALLLASSTLIRVTGSVLAKGANSNFTNFASDPGLVPGAGGGSGGSLRLVAPRLEGNGSLDVSGGTSSNGSPAPAAAGRLRLESLRYVATYSVAPTGSDVHAPPSPVLPPPTAPAVRLARVAGVAVASTPTGSFDVPDVVISAPGAVTVELEARNIPAGTTLSLTFQPVDGTSFSATSTALVAGAAPGDPLTATATVSFPSGHTRVFVLATWTP